MSDFAIKPTSKIALLTTTIGILAFSLVPTTQAQVAYDLVNETGEALSIKFKDQPRTSNALVLYSPDYGKTTRTNPYGVEVSFKPTAEKAAEPTYTTKSISNVWQCQKAGNIKACGNLEIPKGGLVISASDDWRKKLLSFIENSQTFTLNPIWFQTEKVAVSVINPNESNNHSACAFPGCRGGNQLVVYTPGYSEDKDSDTTGTNEFGFEVTIVDDVVVAREGANSIIPKNGYVLSGHGTKKAWLIANAPIGAHITLKDNIITSTISAATYRDQLVRRYNEILTFLKEQTDSKTRTQHISQLNEQFQKLLFTIDEPLNRGEDEVAAKAAVKGLDTLNRELWGLYPSFETSASDQNADKPHTIQTIASLIKGVWHRPTEITPNAIGQTLDDLKAAGFNSVFLETFFHGYTIFPSETYKQYGLAEQNPKYKASGDLLQHWITEAHKRDMQVHVWFETFYVGNKQAYDDGTPPQGPILAKYPQWANIQNSALNKGKLLPSTLESGSFFLDPVNPEAQKFVLSVITEIVKNYDIDGFQLDYIRYPASFPPDRYSYLKTTWGYTPLARQAFMNSRAGHIDPLTFTKQGIKEEQQEQWAEWNHFKVEAISSFVHTATAEIEKIKPDLLISAAVFPKIEDSMVRKHQDWATWGRERWVDFFAPMTLTSAVKVVEENTRLVTEETEHKVKVYSGIFGPFNQNTAEDVLAQINAAKTGGANGYIVFDSAHLTQRMIEALATAHNKKPTKTAAKHTAP